MKHPSGYALIRRHLRRYPHALRQHLLQELNWLVTYEPVIGIMGKTGVGKSSLCNALFRSEVCTVNAVEACTRQPQRVRLRFGNHFLTLVDLPGVGESVTRDGEYRELYRDLMTAHQATRCCRGCFVASVLTVWSAVSHSERCGYHIKVMSLRR
jgi:Predicted GTPase